MCGADLEAMKKLEEWRAQGKHRWYRVRSPQGLDEITVGWKVSLGIGPGTVHAGDQPSLAKVVELAFDALKTMPPVCESCGQPIPAKQ